MTIAGGGLPRILCGSSSYAGTLIVCLMLDPMALSIVFTNVGEAAQTAATREHDGRARLSVGYRQ